MNETTISSKFQVVIPKKIREFYGLRPGQKIVFLPYKNSLRVIIVPQIEAGYGFISGISSNVDRDEDGQE